MKKSILKILTIVVLILSGCSKDEPNSNTSENNQLKQGFWQGMNFESISKRDGNFYPTPVYVNTTKTESTQLQILKNGTFFGSIQGKGKINQNLSFYTINDLTQFDYENYPLNSDQQFYYILKASGKIYITEKDFCLVDITDVKMIPRYYPSGFLSEHPDAFFGTFINGGTITLHDGLGKLKDFYKILGINRGNFYENDLSIGQIQLKYLEH